MLALGAAYTIAHAASMPPTLEDIDSINFALGLRDFNPAEHQPHPPGYPLYIALGRLSLALVRATTGAADRIAGEAHALSLVSAVAGGLALVFAWRVFGLLAAGDAAAGRVRWWATLLLAACPLFWITGSRPLSDMPGLAAAMGTQALLLSGQLLPGAFLAGLVLGIRSQTLWLTAPLLVYALLRTPSWTVRAYAVLAAAAGALCWAVPLLLATGGLDAYLAALGTQAGEDFTHVDMLWANPTPRRLVFALLHTTVFPWASVPLAAAMLVLSITGAAVLLLRNQPAFVRVLVAFGPYVAFHLVVQETITVRYALPVMVPMAFLGARALALSGRATNMVAAPVAAIALITSILALPAYADDAHPAFRAIADVRRRAELDKPALVTSHFELRRPLRVSDTGALPVAYAPLQREWLELVNYWAEGGRGLVWFLANPKRTDLDLIDPHSRRDVVRYRWRAESRPELSGTRPMNVDWYRLRPPGWFLGEGWSLTPETGGRTQADGTGPDRRIIAGYVRRQAGAMHLMVGGRHLGAAADGPAVFELAIDGTVIDRWTLTPEEQNFLRFLPMPSGIPGPEGGYARLTVRALPAIPDRRPPVAIRQFDVQPAARVIAGYGEGWHEAEYDGVSGLRWRWTSERAVLRVSGPPGPVRVRIQGESPLKYFDAAPSVTLSAGDRVIARLQPAADWSIDAVVPADLVAASNGALRLDTTRVFTPAEIRDSPDTRRLGLRIFSVDITTAR